LIKVGARPRVVRLEGLKRNQDLYDWLEAGHGGKELVELAFKVPIEGTITAAAYSFPAERYIER